MFCRGTTFHQHDSLTLIVEIYPGVVIMATPFSVRQVPQIRNLFQRSGNSIVLSQVIWVNNRSKSLVLYGDAAHLRQHRFFIGHSCTYSCHSPEITVETFYPIGSVNHGLYLRGMIQRSHITLMVCIVTHRFECPVVFHYLSHISCHLTAQSVQRLLCP